MQRRNTKGAVYLAIGVNMEGKKELLGIWIGKNEGCKFWMQVVTELKNRGVAQIYVACVDGLKGFPEAINSIFPKTIVQLCIVHMVRNSVKYVSYKDLKAVTADLKAVYSAINLHPDPLALLLSIYDLLDLLESFHNYHYVCYLSISHF